MAKKQSAGEASSEAGKKRRPKTKPAAAKAGAKKPPPKPVKSSKPAAKPAKKRSPPAQAQLPIVEVEEDFSAVAEDESEATEEITPVADAGASLVASTTDDDDDDDEDETTVTVEPGFATSAREETAAEEAPIQLSPEEAELAVLYGEDLNKPAIVHTEYTDRQTADEDRPMVPEINARDERKQQWQERRDRRRQRRDERNQQRHERQQARQESRPDLRLDRYGDQVRSGEQRPAHGHGAQPSRPQIPVPPPTPVPAVAAAAPAVNGHEHDALARVGTPLGDAAATVFAQLRNGQPLPVRQLAAMMRKRSLVETDPEQLWPQLKAELLGDERSYRTLGLRPRIVYRGRDLFAPGPVALSQTADAEANVAAALSRLAGATHRALAARIAKASGGGFERLIHAYLVAAGYREISWVKRVGGIAYAQAIAPGIDRPVLISARSGDQPIDRRGIGELRVGVEAKDLVAGILFSARELSEDAEKELERAGRSIAVMCGDQLVAALIATGVGVVSSAAPLRYVDDQLLDELLAG